MKAFEDKRSKSSHQEVSGQVRGAFRSVLLGWTDPVSGERLRVRLRGEGGLQESLAPLGFEVIGREDGLVRSGAEQGSEADRPGREEQADSPAPGGRILPFQADDWPEVAGRPGPARGPTRHRPGGSAEAG